ncbi:hypothetical protein [Amycolatopsis sp. H20-H5]|uniref:hypothetical protein n=1 Tax=Amycolatopsis sp. H20-H5 TaxID=3046309 RepID=UPI002DB6F40D|nr:hypothetical protein [Amycolatopsis sp. H20-H5]MEC3979394.1 hypothetical protein [Amycolatopsis sp. H20-H5]
MTADQPAPSRQRWLIPVLVVVLSLTVGGGLLARELYRRPEALPPEPIAESTPTSLAPGQEPGLREVEITQDVATHPLNDPVRQVVQTYFDAIIDRNYDQWSKVVTQERLAGKSRADWLHDYRSTKDGSILIYRIEPGSPGSLRVLVGFTSTQDLADAPPYFQERCIRWRLVLPLILESGRWKLDTVEGGTNPEHDKC